MLLVHLKSPLHSATTNKGKAADCLSTLQIKTPESNSVKLIPKQIHHTEPQSRSTQKVRTNYCIIFTCNDCNLLHLSLIYYTKILFTFYK